MSRAIPAWILYFPMRPAQILGGALLLLVGPLSCHSEPDHSDGAAGLTREQLEDPQSCRNCHPGHYRDWSGSMHAYASRDPVFLAMNQRGQEETGGALGDFCVRCHAPVALARGLTFDGLNLEQVPDYAQGVTCYFCHSIESVSGDHNAAVTLATDGSMRAAIDAPMATSAHGSRYSPLHDGSQPQSSALCGACHDIVTPAGVPIERTYREWQSSIFSSGAAATSCGGCHMAGELGHVATVSEQTRLVHDHTLAGVDLALTPFPVDVSATEQAALALEQRQAVEQLLDGSLGIEICVQRLPGLASAIYVTLDNVASGHAWPTGSAQDRRGWLEVVATDDAGTLLYTSGAVADGQPVVGSDPDVWILRDEIFGEAGQSVHMFWDARSFESHTIGVPVTRDPSDPAFYTAHLTRRFPRGLTQVIEGTPSRVAVRVRMRPVGLDVLDDLIGSGHLDREVRDSMQTLTLLPNRHLSSHPELARLSEVTFEWSELTLNHAGFTKRILNDAAFPKECVSAAPPRL